MKFALVVCFAALAAAEPEAKPEAKADPWLAYGYGYPYAYGAYRAYGYGYPYTYGYYGKRSADAEPEAKAEADPALLDSTTATLDTTPDTPMPTTERGPLMLSPRPRLIPPSSTPPTDMVPTPTLTLD